MADPSKPYASDPRSTTELFEALRRSYVADESPLDGLAALHYRGGREEFECACRLTGSGTSPDRELGALVLGQLGWGERAFLEESVDILLGLLRASEPSVVTEAAFALGHRAHPRAVPALAKLAAHPDSGVRFSTACALGHQLDDTVAEAVAAEALIILCRDADRDVRNWATFGLAQMASQDSAAIREVLLERSQETDEEIRGEAMVGLAMRKVPGTAELIRREWAGDVVFSLTLEAAQELGDPSLLPDLLALQAGEDWGRDESLRSNLELAIARCREAAGTSGAA